MMAPGKGSINDCTVEYEDDKDENDHLLTSDSLASTLEGSEHVHVPHDRYSVGIGG